MNFFLCNRCNKKSEDNILNFNSTEILLNNNKQNIINNNIIKKIDSIDDFPNLNIGENIQTSLNDLNNFEEEKDDELEIIEYPYSKNERKIPTSKIRPKQFQNNHSKFNSPNLIERDIINQLNHFDNPQKQNNNMDMKNRLSRKIANNQIKTDELERKDTMTDPASMALSSLIKDINKKQNINNKHNNNEKLNKSKEDEDEIITINDETENNYFIVKNEDEKKSSNLENNNRINNSNIKNTEKKINKIHKKNNKSILNNNKNKKSDYFINKTTKGKISQNKHFSDYNSNIIKKKNLLKNKIVFFKNNNNNNFGGANLLSFSSKKKFPKSYSFNYFIKEKKINNLSFSQKEINYNELGSSLTLNKKNYKLYNNIFKVNEGISSTNKKNNNNKNKLKITHKKVSRAQGPIQKALSSHIAPYH